MDISTVTEFAPASGAAWRAGDAWLGGGTWPFSQPQPGVTRLLDPVASALANAVRDATGVRVTRLPLRRDHVYGVLNAAPNPEGSWSS